MNFVDAIKNVIAAGEDLEDMYELLQDDPDKAQYVKKLTDALMHMEQAAKDIGLPV